MFFSTIYFLLVFFFLDSKRRLKYKYNKEGRFSYDDFCAGIMDNIWYCNQLPLTSV